MLSQISQKYYLLGQLRDMSLDITVLDQLFNALVLSRLRYAIEAISGNLLAADRVRINTALQKAKRWMLTFKIYEYELMAEKADARFAKRILSKEHCLHHLLPEIRKNNRYELRNNDKTYDFPLIKNEKYKNSFIPCNFCFQH